MKLVDLTITNTSKVESFEVLGLVVPRDETVYQSDVPFGRANSLVIAASGIAALNVSVKGMTSTGQGLVTNELSMLRKDNADLKMEVHQLTDIIAMNNATLVEQGILIQELMAAEPAELQRQLDEALMVQAELQRQLDEALMAQAELQRQLDEAMAQAQAPDVQSLSEEAKKPTAKAAKTTKGATK
ncbi:MAG: hypothetical protein ACRC1W_17810 [Shewanella sp.]